MKNKQLALKLLAKDCEKAGRYVDGRKTCAVGCLALASGVDMDALIKLGGAPIQRNALFEVRMLIRAKFNLSDEDLGRIQQANDVNNTVKERRKAVLKIVQAIPAT